MVLAGQQPDRVKTDALRRRVAERIAALQREADRLAGQSRSLLTDLRRLEVERDLQIERVAQAEQDVAVAQAEHQAASERFAAVDRERVASLPDLKTRLVEIYKHGTGGYLRMLFGVRDLRELGRATRAVAAMAKINQDRITKHRRTVDAIRIERGVLEEKARRLEAAQADAQKHRAAAERAVTAHLALIAEIDRRRDLTAQLAGELQVAQENLASAAAESAATGAADSVSVPIAPFRGVLEWPVVGRIIGRFGQASGRLGGSGVRNGIEIAAPEGTPVRVVHPGVVGFADTFTGYGTLVIVDHGANHYSLYGYLSSAVVQRGDPLDAGQELGRVGAAPAGPPALYFELRADGRSVDPVQWLKRR